MKELTIDDFKEFVKNNDDNVFTNNEGLAEHFKNIKSKFMIICKLCGSSKVEIIGADGVEYGEFTGYCEGTNVIKCNECGNADSIDI